MFVRGLLLPVLVACRQVAEGQRLSVAWEPSWWSGGGCQQEGPAAAGEDHAAAPAAAAGQAAGQEAGLPTDFDQE